MASPNVRVDKSVKIRRRHTLPGPLHKIRHPSALYRRSSTDSPPATTASSANTTTQWHHLHQSKTNPYVGWFRHAPSLSTMSSSASLPKSSSPGMKSVNLDTLWLRNWLVDGVIVNHQHKKRRILANDRNFTQFKYQQDNKIKSTLLVQLQQVMEHRIDTTRDLNLDLLLLYKRRNGHLRGGGMDDTNNDNKNNDNSKDLDDSTIEQYLQRQYASSTESITIKALSRIACWLLDIPVYPRTAASASVLSSLKESHVDNIQEVGSILSYEDDDDDESRSVCSYDNHDTISGSRFRTSMTSSTDHGNVIVNQQQRQQDDDDTEERYPVGHGLSSQAEAYYALGAVYRHILAESTPNMSHSDMLRLRSDSVNDIDRLDYEITQMDIVRMNRIASRHLDVESIVRLPVLTYTPQHVSRQRGASGTTGVHTIPEDREPMVSLSTRPESRENVNQPMRRPNNDDHEETHDAEFSWMLVPPTLDDDDDSFGASSMEPYMATNRGPAPPAQDLPPVASHSEHDRDKDTTTTADDDDVCVICLESFVPGDRLRLLPCTHSFHVGCIDRWLSGSHSFHDCYTAGCPTCKARPDTTVARPDTMSLTLPAAAVPSVSSSLSPPLQLHESDGSVPSWAVARIGHILAQESQHF